MHYMIKCVHCLALIQSSTQTAFKISVNELKKQKKSAPKSEVAGHSGMESAVYSGRTAAISREMARQMLSDLPEDLDETIYQSLADTAAAEEHPMQMRQRSALDLDMDSVGQYGGAAVYVTGEELIQNRSLAQDVREIRYEDENPEISVPRNVYHNEVCDEPLVIGYRVKGLLIDGHRYDGELRTRYCPYCHQLLVREAGILPIYNLGLFGHTTAGKTVFLMMQCLIWELRNSYGAVRVPGGILMFDPVNSQFPEKREDTVNQAAEYFAEKGIFPPTTHEHPAPHCVKATYADDNRNVLRSCVLCFHDICGESVAIRGEDERFQKALKLIDSADGVLLVTDPMMLERARQAIPEWKRPTHAESEKLVQDVMKAIREQTEKSTDVIIRKPAVCLLTKQDILCQNWRALKIPPAQQVIADTRTDFDPDRMNIGYNWYADMYQPLVESTRHCLHHLEQGNDKTWEQAFDGNGEWTGFIEMKFSEVAFFPLSAIGKRVRILRLPKEDGSGTDDLLVTPQEWEDYMRLVEESTGDEPTQQMLDLASRIRRNNRPLRDCSPYCIELPAIYFLSTFGIIPPMNSRTFYENVSTEQMPWYKALFTHTPHRLDFSEKLRIWRENYVLPKKF